MQKFPLGMLILRQNFSNFVSPVLNSTTHIAIDSASTAAVRAAVAAASSLLTGTMVQVANPKNLIGFAKNNHIQHKNAESSC